MPKRRGRGRRGSIATSGNKIQCSPANSYGKGVTEKNTKVLQVQDYKYKVLIGSSIKLDLPG